jgi:hypothetical protein
MTSENRLELHVLLGENFTRKPVPVLKYYIIVVNFPFIG